MKSRSRVIGYYHDRNALEFDMHLVAADVPVKFHSDWKRFKSKSRSFETSRDLSVRRPPALWREALGGDQFYYASVCVVKILSIFLDLDTVNLLHPIYIVRHLYLRKQDNNCFSQCLLMQTCYLKQCRLLSNWITRNKFQANLHRYDNYLWPKFRLQNVRHFVEVPIVL